jgi:sterol desaturase/sphingolipid hydroxylase (fatty acid hydroxylase superfamily)
MFRDILAPCAVIAAWLALEPIYQASYSWLLQSFTPTWAYIVGSNIITIGVYWVAVIPLSIIDWWPTEWSMSIRIQNPIDLRSQNEHFSPSRMTRRLATSGNWEHAMMMSPAWNSRRAALFWQAIRESARNQLVGLVFGAALIILANDRPSDDALTTSWFGMLFYIALTMVVNDAFFFYFHRLMHTRWLYPLHKPHHQYVSPFAAAAIACHPVEHMICNILPVISSPVIVGAPLTVTWFWMTLALFNVTVMSHSGYNWPGIPTSGEAHDWHHLYLDEYFGASGIFDWLHGTDCKFRASKQARRMGATTRAEFQRITFE